MLNACLTERACTSPLSLGGSLLERKRSQLGFLPPPTSEFEDGTVSISSPIQDQEQMYRSPMNLVDAIETPPYNSLSLEINPTEECTDKFSPSVFSPGHGRLLSRFEDNIRRTASSTVEFCEKVYVHFYSTDSPATSVSCVGPQVGRVKRFDGRSDCERGVLFEDCLDIYLAKMGTRCYDEEDEEGMDQDFLFCCESEEVYDRQRRRRRPRFYAADETTLTWNNSSLCEEDSGSSLLWMMENTPCDCDLLIVG